jgi:hypothetical protein
MKTPRQTINKKIKIWWKFPVGFSAWSFELECDFFDCFERFSVILFWIVALTVNSKVLEFRSEVGSNPPNFYNFGTIKCFHVFFILFFYWMVPWEFFPLKNKKRPSNFAAFFLPKINFKNSRVYLINEPLNF